MNIIKNKSDSLKGSVSPMTGKTRKFYKKFGNHQLRRAAKNILGSDDPDQMVFAATEPGHWS